MQVSISLRTTGTVRTRSDGPEKEDGRQEAPAAGSVRNPTEDKLTKRIGLPQPGVTLPTPTPKPLEALLAAERRAPVQQLTAATPTRRVPLLGKTLTGIRVNNLLQPTTDQPVHDCEFPTRATNLSRQAFFGRLGR